VTPLLIVGLIVVALVVAFFFFGLTPDPGRRRTPGLLKRRSKWRRLIPVVPLLGAVGCLVLAFGGFSFIASQESAVTVLVMDVSESMEETDIGETRLQAAQDAALEFLDQLPPEFEVGLVTFAGDASLVVAPTTNRASVTEAVDAFETSTGTHIWDGLEAGLDAIERRRAGGDTGAAVLLMSDGRDTGSFADRFEVSQRAVEMGVPVYGVLLGEAGGERGAEIDELRAATLPTGGETFTAGSADQLSDRFRSIGSQVSVDLAADPSTTPLVVAAIALVILAGILLIAVQR
jgi:Ca-activated chloride channel homolog